jgi:hypothetical protein
VLERNLSSFCSSIISYTYTSNASTKRQIIWQEKQQHPPIFISSNTFHAPMTTSGLEWKEEGMEEGRIYLEGCNTLKFDPLEI